MSNIKVGDLVVVVKPSICSGLDDRIGHTYIVRDIDSWAEGGVCRWCLGRHQGFFYAYDENEDAFPLQRLKRIPPLEELEGQRTEEKLKEPA